MFGIECSQSFDKYAVTAIDNEETFLQNFLENNGEIFPRYNMTDNIFSGFELRTTHYVISANKTLTWKYKVQNSSTIKKTVLKMIVSVFISKK